MCVCVCVRVRVRADALTVPALANERSCLCRFMPAVPRSKLAEGRDKALKCVGM